MPRVFITCFAMVAIAVVCTRAAVAQQAERLEITVERAELKSGANTVGTATRGQQFNVLDSRDGYYRIEIDSTGRKQSGWVYSDQIRLLSAVVKKSDAPPPIEYLRIVAPTPVHVGAEVVGEARPGEIYRLMRDQSPWLEIEFLTPDGPRSAFVQSPTVQRVAERDVASLRDGMTPASVASGTVVTDGTAGTATVRAELPLRSDAGALDVELHSDSGWQAPLEVSREKSSVLISGTWPAFHGRLTPGTRSLWVLDDAGSSQPRRHRVDLAAVKLLPSIDSARYDAYPNQRFLLVPVENLLPDATVLFAETFKDEPIKLRPLETSASFLPRWVDAYSHDGRTFLRIALPEAAASTASWLYVRVRNPDGSLSNTVAVTRRGAEFSRPATTFDDAAPLPVDVAAIVPAVELLTVREARGALDAAGLKLRAVHHVTGQPLKTDDALELIITRQAVPAGSRLLTGEVCVVSVQPTEEPLPVNISGANMNRAAAIQVDDALGFAPIHADRLLPEVARGQLIDDSSALPSGSDARTKEVAALWLALGDDPGVSIIPDRSPQLDAEAALLKLLLAATIAHVDSGELPGELGRALNGAMSKLEPDIRKMLAQSAENRTAALELLLDLIAAELKLAPIQGAERAEMLAAWQEHVRQITQPEEFDFAGDGRVADDAVTWVMGWLFDHGRYTPISRTLFTMDRGGLPIARLDVSEASDNQLPQDWFEGDKLPIVARGASRVAAPQAAEPSTAPAEVAVRRGPAEVRIPLVQAESVQTIDDRFRAIGLLIDQPGQLFTTDTVVASMPAQQEWVDAGATVQLEIRREVPSLLGLATEQIAPRLSAWRLKHRPRGPADPANVVVEQQPVAGAFIALDEPIELELHAITPYVVGALVREADPAIDGARLKRMAKTKVFKEDKIIEQTPPAGVLSDHGAPLQLTVHTPVPAIDGLTLAEARDSLRQWDFVAAVPNSLAHREDRVRGQSPPAGEFIPHQSGVTLDPVKGAVPKVVGFSVAEARRQLRDRENYKVELLGELINGDIITAQTPVAATELERGQSVSIDARVSAPDVARLPVLTAIERVSKAPGSLRPAVVGAVGKHDLAFSQDPRAGESLYPRTTITIVPGIELPNLESNSPEQAAAALSKLSVRAQVSARSTLETSDPAEIGRLLVTAQSPSPGFYPRGELTVVSLGIGRMVLGLRTVPAVWDGATWDQMADELQRRNLRASAVLATRVNGEEQSMSFAQFRSAANSRRFGSNVRLELLGTTPAGGSQVVMGSNVTLHVLIHPQPTPNESP